MFGTIGDLVIGYFDEQQFGLAMGAVLFGIGHLFCLVCLVQGTFFDVIDMQLINVGN